MRYLFIILFFSVLIFISCNSDDEEIVSDNDTINFEPDEQNNDETDLEPLLDQDVTEIQDIDTSAPDEANMPDQDNEQGCFEEGTFCDSSDMSKVFKCENGEKIIDKECDSSSGSRCLSGKCISLCDIAESEKSYEGCDYFTAKLHNFIDNPSFGIAVTNSNITYTAKVSIYVFENGVQKEINYGSGLLSKNFKVCRQSGSFPYYGSMKCSAVDSSLNIDVAPGEAIVLKPHENDDRMIDSTGISWNSYRITSTIPVSAYQFNPLDNSDSESTNDASLLIPPSRLSTEYVVGGYMDFAGEEKSRAYITIIGTDDEGTDLIINSPVADISGGNGIPATSRGNDFEISLKKGEVANIETSKKYAEFSGTKIKCKDESAKCHPYVVFSGTVASNIPANINYADHLEHQMIPTDLWGTEFLVVKSKQRGNESDYIRVIAKETETVVNIPGTDISFTIPEGVPYSFYLGSKLPSSDTFNIKSDAIRITANKPVMVLQFLEGSVSADSSCASDTSSPTCYGDPSMTIIPPIEQYRDNYVFVTPGSYSKNFALITGKADDTIKINDTDIILNKYFSASDSSGYTIYDLGQSFQQHKVTCNSCGIIIYGWDKDVSYMYPGGMNTKKLR